MRMLSFAAGLGVDGRICGVFNGNIGLREKGRAHRVAPVAVLNRTHGGYNDAELQIKVGD